MKWISIIDKNLLIEPAPMHTIHKTNFRNVRVVIQTNLTG